MRILFWSSTFWPKIGGVEVLASRLLPALQSFGHEFAVIAPKLGHQQEDQSPFRDIPIHRFSFTDPSIFRDMDLLATTRQRISKIKREFQADLVHVNAIDAGIFFHLTTWHEHVAPMLVTLHGKWNNLQAIRNSLITSTLDKASWVVGCSNAILDYGRGFSPGIGNRSSVIYNGIEPHSSEIEPLAFQPPTVLCLGRLVEDKGIDVALNAFVSVTERHPELRILIAGDGEARADLERQAADLGLNNVEFLGWVAPADVPALVNRAAIVVMPSRQDSFPLTALEAGMMGRPVVATRVGGLPEMVQDGKTGVLIGSEDVTALAEAVAALLASPQRAVRLGQAAREQVHQKFSWEGHIKAYDRLYRDLSAAKTSAIRRVPGNACTGDV
jgi:glycogen(starch) synthase